MNRTFGQKLILVTILVASLAFMTALAMGTPQNNPFLTQDGHLIAELEFQDGQMGFVGISGITWTILSNGSCQASRFVNDTVSSPHETCHLDQQDLVMLANTLSDQDYADLPSEIPSEPTLNPHRLTIRLGEKSSTLVLQTGESIEHALTPSHNQHETPRSRFLTIAQAIDRLIQQNCRDD
jgi:hypothetical protein